MGILVNVHINFKAKRQVYIYIQSNPLINNGINAPRSHITRKVQMDPSVATAAACAAASQFVSNVPGAADGWAPMLPRSIDWKTLSHVIVLPE